MSQATVGFVFSGAEYAIVYQDIRPPLCLNVILHGILLFLYIFNTHIQLRSHKFAYHLRQHATYKMLIIETK